MTPIVKAEGVVKRWGSTEALAGASFEIGSGITGLLGPNGAGNLTLLGLVLGNAARVDARPHPPDRPRPFRARLGAP